MGRAGKQQGPARYPTLAETVGFCATARGRGQQAAQLLPRSQGGARQRGERFSLAAERCGRAALERFANEIS